MPDPDNGRLELIADAGVTVGTRWYPDAPTTQPTGR